MDLARIKAIVGYYDDVLIRQYGVLVPRQLPDAPELARTSSLPTPELFHVRYMISEMQVMLANPQKTEKAMRWLGFIQGVLWAKQIFTLEELKNHSRPDFPPPQWRE